MDDRYSEQEQLEQSLRDIQRMRAEMHSSRLEADNMAAELETLRLERSITELSYVVYQERLRRSREDINFCLRRLNQERNITLRKLHDLEQE